MIDVSAYGFKVQARTPKMEDSDAKKILDIVLFKLRKSDKNASYRLMDGASFKADTVQVEFTFHGQDEIYISSVDRDNDKFHVSLGRVQRLCSVEKLHDVIAFVFMLNKRIEEIKVAGCIINTESLRGSKEIMEVASSILHDNESLLDIHSSCTFSSRNIAIRPQSTKTSTRMFSVEDQISIPKDEYSLPDFHKIFNDPRVKEAISNWYAQIAESVAETLKTQLNQIETCKQLSAKFDDHA